MLIHGNLATRLSGVLLSGDCVNLSLKVSTAFFS